MFKIIPSPVKHGANKNHKYSLSNCWMDEYDDWAEAAREMANDN